MDDEKGPSLAVPLALDAGGEEVRPDTGERGIRYTCPSCRGLVAFRSGTQKRPHFYHLVRPQTCDFLNETEEHWRAKHRVVQMVSEGRAVWLDRCCGTCSERTQQPIPTRVVRASTEHTLPSGHRVDVALFDAEEKLVGVIEVFATHEVDEVKSGAMEALKWGEITSETILASDVWEVKRDHFAPFTCGKCRWREANTRFYPFESPHRRNVPCPLYGRSLSAVDQCGGCEYFLDVGEAGIACFGSAGRNGTHR